MIRRALLRAGAVSSAAGISWSSVSAEAEGGVGDNDPRRNYGFWGAKDDPDFGQFHGESIGGAATGIGASRAMEVATGFRCLFQSQQYATSPFRVAEYFEGLQITNADGDPFNAEWPHRANPLIVGFLSMTNLFEVEGDETPWCAAFLGFCLGVAGYASTNSPLSGSYRKHGNEERNALTVQRGDIVVFRKNGPDGDKGFGHVGFYVEHLNDRQIVVLGGNQRGVQRRRNNGMVTRTTYTIDTRSTNNPKKLSVHSFRAIDGIPRAQYYG